MKISKGMDLASAWMKENNVDGDPNKLKFTSIGHVLARFADDKFKYIDQLEAENKKLKEASSILNTIGKDTPCPTCHNKMVYKPRIYHCNHCGSDFN